MGRIDINFEQPLQQKINFFGSFFEKNYLCMSLLHEKH